MLGIALVVVERAHRLVDGNLVEVRPTKTQHLGIQIGEQTPLQQRVIGEVDPRHDVGRIEGDLLGLGEVVVRVTVQHHLADRHHRHQRFGDQLGRIEDIEVEAVLVLLLDHLDAQLPLQRRAALDVIPHHAAVEVRVTSPQLLGFIPDQRAGTGHRLPVELDEARHAFTVDQTEGMHTEAFHVAVMAREGAVRHGPQHGVSGFRHQ